MPSSSSFIVVGSLSSQATPLGGQLISGVFDIVTTAPVEGEKTFKLAGSVNGSVLETDPTELESEQSFISNEMFKAMGGVYELAVKDKIQSLIDQDITRTRTTAQRAEDDAYSSVLKLMVTGITKEDLPEGLWEQMSGPQQNTIQNSIDADVATENKAKLFKNIFRFIV